MNSKVMLTEMKLGNNLSCRGNTPCYVALAMSHELSYCNLNGLVEHNIHMIGKSIYPGIRFTSSLMIILIEIYKLEKIQRTTVFSVDRLLLSGMRSGQSERKW